jgi:AcrR family transcriptional regulator
LGKSHAAAPATTEGRSSAERLLAATERLVLVEGAAGLSIRRIGVEAGLNSALVSYYFDGLPGLLEVLLTSNATTIHDARSGGLREAMTEHDHSRRLTALITAYVEPIWLTPAVWSRESARAVVRELLPAVDPAVRQRTVARINESVEAVAKPMLPLLPHLSHDELFLRLRLLSGATEMLQPRLDELGLYPVHSALKKSKLEQLRVEILRFSKGALLGP